MLEKKTDQLYSFSDEKVPSEIPMGQGIEHFIDKKENNFYFKHAFLTQMIIGFIHRYALHFVSLVALMAPLKAFK